MLDFFLIADDQPDNPEQAPSELIGGLNLETFSRLQIKRIIDPELDYYEDFRWDSDAINRLRIVLLTHHAYQDADVQALLDLLEAAYRHQKGLIAYAD